MNSGALLEITNLLLALSSLIQNDSIFHLEASKSSEMHSNIINTGSSQHEEVSIAAKTTYMVESLVSVVEHFQQLDADLLDSARDSERDMFDQKNRHHQTIILSSSAMFSALATVIIQGILPNSTNNIIVALYGLSSSLSFAFLFISIILCIQIIRVSSEFMYTKAYKQRRIFSKLLTDFNKKFGKEKSIAIGLVASSTINGPVSGGAPVSDAADAAGQGGRISPIGNKRASLVQDDNYISMQWKSHVESIRNYLNERTNINKASIDTEPDRSVRNGAKKNATSSGIGMPSFENHWKKHLKYFSLVASRCFFLGTGFLQVAILLYLWTIFDIYYSSRAGAIISVTIIGFALSISLVALRRLCFHSSRSKVAANSADAATPVSNVEDPASPMKRQESVETEDSSFSSKPSFIDNLFHNLFQKKKKT
jgi:hypothetical protein